MQLPESDEAQDLLVKHNSEFSVDLLLARVEKKALFGPLGRHVVKRAIRLSRGSTKQWNLMPVAEALLQSAQMNDVLIGCWMYSGDATYMERLQARWESGQTDCSAAWALQSLKRQYPDQLPMINEGISPEIRPSDLALWGVNHSASQASGWEFFVFVFFAATLCAVFAS